MSSNNDRCFQCQEISHMACYCPHIWCYDCDNYRQLPWTARIKYPHLACWHTAEVTLLTGVIDPPLDIVATPDILTMITRIDRGSVTPVITPIGVTPGHSTDLPNVVSHATEAQVPTTTAMTHHTADLHPIGIFPEMTADLDTNPKNTTTNQHKDPCPLHK